MNAFSGSKFSWFLNAFTGWKKKGKEKKNKGLSVYWLAVTELSLLITKKIWVDFFFPFGSNLRPCLFPFRDYNAWVGFITILLRTSKKEP